MTTEQFAKCFEARVDLCRRVLIGKNADYARGNDKLHNFKEAAKMEGCSEFQALRGMLLKHWQSIRDLCNDIDKGMYHNMDIWEEKIGDALNYLFLLRAILQEKYQPVFEAPSEDEINYMLAEAARELKIAMIQQMAEELMEEFNAN